MNKVGTFFQHPSSNDCSSIRMPSYCNITAYGLGNRLLGPRGKAESRCVRGECGSRSWHIRLCARVATLHAHAHACGGFGCGLSHVNNERIDLHRTQTNRFSSASRSRRPASRSCCSRPHCHASSSHPHAGAALRGGHSGGSAGGCWRGSIAEENADVPRSVAREDEHAEVLPRSRRVTAGHGGYMAKSLCGHAAAVTG